MECDDGPVTAAGMQTGGLKLRVGGALSPDGFLFQAPSGSHTQTRDKREKRKSWFRGGMRRLSQSE